MQGWLSGCWWLTALPQRLNRFRESAPQLKLFLMPDGGYMVAGNSDNFPLHLRDNFLLFRTGPDPLYNSIRLVDPLLPSNFVMESVYPNPFNSRTTIAYQLPEHTSVSIQVFDVRGRIIATLVDDMVEAGHHQVSWNGANIPTGIYFCKMTSSAYTETIKLLLVK